MFDPLLQSQPDMEGLRAVCLWSQFIPLEDEVLDFFQPVASNILRKLRAEACMPTQPVAGQGRKMTHDEQVYFAVFSGKLWHLQHNCVGDTIVYH